MTETLSAPPLSRVRTFLFGGLALVWFGEMLFTGVQPFAETWTRFWKMYAPDNPPLAAALYITHAFEAPLMAALLVLALFGKSDARTVSTVALSANQAYRTITHGPASLGSACCAGSLMNKNDTQRMLLKTVAIVIELTLVLGSGTRC